MSKGFRNLKIYHKALNLSTRIFRLTLSFPKEEQYELVNQIRRSSRSVCATIGEAYRKRQYPKHFISKLSDVDMENTETQVWLDVSYTCNYINEDQYFELNELSSEIGKMLNHMINNPEKYT